ncbi:ABC transporter ATP-binding protein [Rothia aerolata]|uniref:ABC transporter n=1 Tax=Rothia aerolata TaxID=1812262 RepID=A0A917IRQ7_9MICC|nr:ABC transporter ATP-binding protein [Rothia aerolata]GGH61314.1 ABC transporter [Rothia aerolata]
MARVAPVLQEDRVELSAEEQKQAQARSLKLLRSVLRPLKKQLILTLVLVVVSVGLTTALPLLLSYGIDNTITPLMEGHSGPVTLVVALYFAAAVLAGLTLYANVVLTTKVSQRALFDLRKRMFGHAQRLSVQFHETYTSGRVVSRLTSDLETLKSFLDSGLSQLASTLLSMVFTVAALVLLDWRAGVGLLVAAVPIYFLTRWFRKHSALAYRAQRVVNAQLIGRFVETFTGIRAVKAFRYEPQARSAYGNIAEDFRVKVMDSIKVNGIFMPSLTAIGNVFLGTVMIIGGYAVLGGSMQVGTLLALAIYANRVFEPVMALSDFYNLFQSAVSALEKVSSFLEEEPSVAEPEHPVTREGKPSGDVLFDNVSFSYLPGRPALHPLDLHVPAGQQVALVGKTGAGKSTVAKLIARFYDVSSGRLLLDGVDIRDLSDEQLRREVVMITQEAFLFSGSVADNIRLARPSASDEEVIAAARSVGAHDFIMNLPSGYETNLAKRGGRVSAGQRQLISFARAFLVNPSVLILDEATASLDIPTERLVQRGLARLLQGRTSFVIAHRLSTVLDSDRVLVVSEGRMIEDGAPSALITAGGVFAEMVDSWNETMAVEE